MKVQFIFDKIEDREDLDMYYQAPNLYGALWDIQEYILRRYKHADPDSGAVLKEYEEIKEEIFKIMNDNEVNL